jgi:predicted Zn-dependent protease
LAIESITALIDYAYIHLEPIQNEYIAAYASAYSDARKCDYSSALEKYLRLSTKLKLNPTIMLRIADLQFNFGDSIQSQNYYSKVLNAYIRLEHVTLILSNKWIDLLLY